MIRSHHNFSYQMTNYHVSKLIKKKSLQTKKIRESTLSWKALLNFLKFKNAYHGI